jgi:hypothetical protein
LFRILEFVPFFAVDGRNNGTNVRYQMLTKEHEAFFCEFVPAGEMLEAIAGYGFARFVPFLDFAFRK